MNIIGIISCRNFNLSGRDPMPRRTTLKRRPRKATLKKKIIKIQKQMPHQEIKFVTSSNVEQAMTTTPSYNGVYPQQGTTSSTRTAGKIRIIGYHFMHKARNSSTAGVSHEVRCCVFIDNAVQGTAPQASQLLTTATSPGNIMSPFDTHLVGGKSVSFMRGTVSGTGIRKAYTLLFDHVDVLTPQLVTVAGATENSTWNGRTIRFIRKTGKCNVTVNFDGNAGTVADVIDRYIYFGSWADNAVMLEDWNFTYFFVDEI